MNSSSDNQEPVELLADEFMERKRRGEQPTIDDYCQLHPELAEEIRRAGGQEILDEIARTELE